MINLTPGQLHCPGVDGQWLIALLSVALRHTATFNIAKYDMIEVVICNHHV